MGFLSRLFGKSEKKPRSDSAPPGEEAGEKELQQPKVCISCGQKNASAYLKCVACGGQLGETTSPVPAEKATSSALERVGAALQGEFAKAKQATRRHYLVIRQPEIRWALVLAEFYHPSFEDVQKVVRMGVLPGVDEVTPMTTTRRLTPERAVMEPIVRDYAVLYPQIRLETAIICMVEV